MYQFSRYSYRLKNLLTGEIIVPDDSNPSFLEFQQWTLLGNQPEIAECFEEEFHEMQTKRVLYELNQVLTSIVSRSLSLAMNKKMSEELPYFEAAYRIKYALCKGHRTDPYNTILQESELEGYSNVEDFKADVILKFEAGEQLRDSIIQMTEVVRKAMMRDMELYQDFDKARQRMEIISGIIELNVQQAISVLQSAINLQ